MPEELGRLISIASLLIAGTLGAWTAWACRRAQRRGLQGSDAVVWAGLSAVFLLVSQTKLARVLGLLSGWGQWLRILAREHGLYAGRRPVQVLATAGVALVVAVLLVIGLVWAWHYIKRYRLAIGFASLAVGLGLIRFISLHEVDAWYAEMPWLRALIEVTAAAGASAVALARLRQLGELRWLQPPG